MQRLNPPAQLTRCARLAAVPAQLSPGLVRALTHPATVTLLKTAVTQLVYETSSGAAYLSLQAGLRGRGLRGNQELRQLGFGAERVARAAGEEKYQDLHVHDPRANELPDPEPQDNLQCMINPLQSKFDWIQRTRSILNLRSGRFRKIPQRLLPLRTLPPQWLRGYRTPGGNTSLRC